MPNAYVLNQRPISYGHAFALLTEMLFNAGWTYQQSGDGLSNFGSGKVFNNFTVGAANSWNNTSAWARMQDPSGVREFVFLQPSSLGSIRIKYSCAAKFISTITGAVSATNAPSALDEQWIAGSNFTNGYAPATNPGAWFSVGTTLGATVYMGAAMSGAPYGFWFAGADSPRGQIRSGILFDPVSSVPEDPDPYVITIGGSSCFLSTSQFYGRNMIDGGTSFAGVNGNYNPSYEGSFGYMDVAKTQFVNVHPASYGFGSSNQFVMDTGIPENPFNGKPEALPMCYMRPNYGFAGITRNAGVKGWSTMARWTGSPKATFCDTYNNRSAVAVGAIWLPWDGVTQPLV